jgi:hypothetical protein
MNELTPGQIASIAAGLEDEGWGIIHSEEHDNMFWAERAGIYYDFTLLVSASHGIRIEGCSVPVDAVLISALAVIDAALASAEEE